MLQQLSTTLLTLPGIIIGLSFHEYAHAWMSDKLGDPTPRRQGRLTINPVAHIDPLGFVALLVCRFGWGKPVEINPGYYRNRKRDEILVGIAGVIMNLLIAIVFSVVTRVLNGVSAGMGYPEFMQLVVELCYYVVVINLCLMIFNLLPIPPLDGFGIVTQLFNLEKYSWFYTLMNYGPYILLAVIIFDLHEIVLVPLLNIFLGIML